MLGFSNFCGEGSSAPSAVGAGAFFLFLVFLLGGVCGSFAFTSPTSIRLEAPLVDGVEAADEVRLIFLNCLMNSFAVDLFSNFFVKSFF